MDKTTAGFGSYLMTHRLARDLGIDELARVTRVGEQTLRWIEDQDIQRLPAPVFVQGFLRAYAKAVGADGDEAVRRYQQALAQRGSGLESHRDLNPIRPSTWSQMLTAMVLMATWMGLSVWVLNADPPSSGNPASAEAVATQAGVSMAPRASAASDLTDHGIGVAQAAYRLEINALATTWLQVSIDDQVPRQLRIQAGQQAQLAARTGFVLLLGDAGAVSLQLNGKPLPAPGPSGQVKTLKLP